MEKQRHPALDYLLLGPHERINYRVRRGLTIKEWYDGLRSEHMEGEEVEASKVRQLLGLTCIQFYKSKKNGYFGETRNVERDKIVNTVVKVSMVNEILDEASYLVPVSDFLDEIERSEWYMKRVSFDKNFSDYYRSFLGQRQPYVSVADAARMISQMRQRKLMIEKWPGLEDLNRESGMNLPVGRMYARYGNMIAIGELPVYVVGNCDKKGNIRRGRRYVIPPHEYRRVLERERETLRTLRTGMTMREIANASGLSRDYVEAQVRVGKELGLLHPIRGLLGYNGKILPREEAEGLAQRSIRVPVDAVRRIKHLNLSREDLKKQLEIERRRTLAKASGVTTDALARQMGLSRRHLDVILKRARELGELTLPDDRSVLRRRPYVIYIISPQDAERLISGDIGVYSSPEEFADFTGVPADDVETLFNAGMLRGKVDMNRILIKLAGYENVLRRYKSGQINFQEIFDRLEQVDEWAEEAVVCTITDIAEFYGLSKGDVERRVQEAGIRRWNDGTHMATQVAKGFGRLGTFPH